MLFFFFFPLKISLQSVPVYFTFSFFWNSSAHTLRWSRWRIFLRTSEVNREKRFWDERKEILMNIRVEKKKKTRPEAHEGSNAMAVAPVTTRAACVGSAVSRITRVSWLPDGRAGRAKGGGRQRRLCDNQYSATPLSRQEKHAPACALERYFLSFYYLFLSVLLRLAGIFFPTRDVFFLFI